MVVGLKQSVPYVIQAIPEISVNGSWLLQQMERNVKVLAEAGFSVRAILSDNHSSNVNAYCSLIEKFETGSSYCIQHPSNDKKTYLIFDTVHIMKNIRNNLLNKKFVFPSFNFNESSITLSCPNRFIAWSDLHKIYENDSKLKGN